MERLLTDGLVIGIPFIVICILYTICHYGPFIRMNRENELPDVHTLTPKYDKVYDKRKQKAWLRIRSDIVYAAEHGKRHASISPEDYIDIPYEEFKGELENRGYILENHSEKWYKENFSINVSWEDK